MTLVRELARIAFELRAIRKELRAINRRADLEAMTELKAVVETAPTLMFRVEHPAK